jgi:hypothetical protein
VVEQRGFVADADLAAFLNAGYTRRRSSRCCSAWAAKTFNNYVTDARAAERSVRGRAAKRW